MLYPDGDADGFRPTVSEFFTLLEVMARVHSGRERLPLDPGVLLSDLRAEIASGLANEVERVRSRVATTPHYSWLANPKRRRPDVIITSNWDTLAETAAYRSGLTVHLTWPRRNDSRVAALDERSIVVLKLHGSTDWGRTSDERFAAATRTWEYDRLDAAIAPVKQPARRSSLAGDEIVVRYRSVDHPVASSRSAGGFSAPLMATMAAGKDTFISDLSGIWDDAYWILSRAERLDIIGYSFPADDLELRTLLRVSTRQPGSAALASGVTLSVCNPSPDTHERARSFLGTDLEASFEGAGSWLMPRK